MKCPLCDRIVDKKDYCTLHSQAYRNLVKKFESWRKARKISWQEYLNEIAENQFTGEWAKEMAEHLMRLGEKESVAES